MAQGYCRKYMTEDHICVKKKYLYVLRPVLACEWIERDFGPVPTEFVKLVDRLVPDPVLKTAIDDLLSRKKAGREMDHSPKIPVISDFVDRELDRLTSVHVHEPLIKKPDKLDAVFRQALQLVFYSESSSILQKSFG